MVLALCLFWAGSGVAAQLCPPPRTALKPVVKVVIREPATTIDHSRSQAQIEALGQKAGVQGASRNSRMHIVGLTISELGTRLSMNAKVAGANKASGYCVQIQDLTIKLSYEKQVIYVPREYPKGSCAYGAVLDHERQHAEINRKALHDYSGPLRQRALTELKALGPIYVTTKADVDRRAGQIIEQRLAGAFKQFHASRDSNHARIDTEREYARVQARCKDW